MLEASRLLTSALTFNSPIERSDTKYRSNVEASGKLHEAMLQEQYADCMTCGRHNMNENKR